MNTPAQKTPLGLSYVSPAGDIHRLRAIILDTEEPYAPLAWFSVTDLIGCLHPTNIDLSSFLYQGVISTPHGLLIHEYDVIEILSAHNTNDVVRHLLRWFKHHALKRTRIAAFDVWSSSKQSPLPPRRSHDPLIDLNAV